MNYIENRPWGKFEVLSDTTTCKVKQITINSGQSPSYQYHFKREEFWIIVSGNGMVKLGDKSFEVKPRDVIHVMKLQPHQIKNTGNEPLIFIEVQLGEYFGEDDIIRIEDSYGRK